ncbi:hypothetical protein PG997_014938 [Apiospora hydei]|uniref:Ankyrin repeat protein n=1 Tax=Apiospora hydei TaxID=1337664 RepID=A0ABR1UXR4_9PEZI
MYIAAFQGHVEVLRTLLEIESNPERLSWLHEECVSFAREGNQEGPLDVCLQSTCYEKYPIGVVSSLAEATSIPIFDRIYRLCKDCISVDPQQDTAQAQTEFLTATFRRAAAAGNLVMMKHLVRLGASPTHVDQRGDGNVKYQALISGVAAKGHADVLAYLLENGAEITSRALEAACQHGNPDTVRVLLVHGARDTWMPGNALLEAVKGENETALRLLLGAGTIVYEDQRRRALDAAQQLGLSSMAKILEEYGQRARISPIPRTTGTSSPPIRAPSATRDTSSDARCALIPPARSAVTSSRRTLSAPPA